jgi:hypothetical protein
MPRIHPREAMVLAAEIRLRAAVTNELHGLTTAERLRVLAAVLGDTVGSIAKYAIREERHGDQDKPGGVE